MKSRTTKPKRTPSPSSIRVGTIVVVVILLLLLLGGIEALIIGLGDMQEATTLTAAPVCASGQDVGCRLHEKVTVVDLTTHYPTRGSPQLIVEVRKPDGSTQSLIDHDSGDLYPLLYVNEVVSAELWKGSVIRLEDDAGHILIAEDSPVVTGSLLPIIGVLFIVGSSALLFLFVRAVRRARRIMALS